MAAPRFPDPNGPDYKEWKENFDYWQKYNGEGPWNAARLEKDFRRRSYDSQRDRLTVSVQDIELGPPGVYQGTIKDSPATRAENAKLLSQELPELASPNRPIEGWTGVKVLGRGGFGVVTHWSFDRSQAKGVDNTPFDVAVKEVSSPDKELTSEALIMYNMPTQAEHVVKILRKPCQNLTPEERGSLGEEWKGKIKRFVMEFCSVGDVKSLIDRRTVIKSPFKEITLWHIFEDLVDALCIFEYQKKLSLDAQGDVIGPNATHTEAFVHFDLKPMNVFLGDPVKPKNPSPAGQPTVVPSVIPAAKIGDYGLSKLHRKRSKSDSGRERLRRRGTKGYYAPEQFTPKWNFNDWKNSGVAGNYGPWTNVWGIGAIMWELLMLRHIRQLNPLVTPFISKLQNAARSPLPVGRTLGAGIEDTKYSDELRILVLRCLMEVPADRVKLDELKRTIAAVTRTCQDPAEPRDSFLPAPATRSLIPPKKANPNALKRPPGVAAPAVIPGPIVPPPPVAPADTPQQIAKRALAAKMKNNPPVPPFPQAPANPNPFDVAPQPQGPNIGNAPFGPPKPPAPKPPAPQTKTPSRNNNIYNPAILRGPPAPNPPAPQLKIPPRNNNDPTNLQAPPTPIQPAPPRKSGRRVTDNNPPVPQAGAPPPLPPPGAQPPVAKQSKTPPAPQPEAPRRMNNNNPPAPIPPVPAPQPLRRSARNRPAPIPLAPLPQTPGRDRANNNPPPPNPNPNRPAPQRYRGFETLSTPPRYMNPMPGRVVNMLQYDMEQCAFEDEYGTRCVQIKRQAPGPDTRCNEHWGWRQLFDRDD